jgi:hypothetical protein
MVAMGSIYQLVPVAFLTKIWNEKFGFIQFFVTALGIAAFLLVRYIGHHRKPLSLVLLLY